MSRDVVCTGPDTHVTGVVALMTRHRIGCIPIVDARQIPIGMVTKSDLIRQLATPEAGRARTARDVMSAEPITVDEHATIAETAALMMREQTHHVLVICIERVLVGVASARDIVGWVLKNEVLLPERHDPVTGPPVWHPLEG